MVRPVPLFRSNQVKEREDELMSRFQMQPPREESVSALMKAAAGAAAATAFFIGVETFFPGMLEERLKARAERRRIRKLSGRFRMARAAINAKQQLPQTLIIEGERGEFLRAIEQTISSMPFGKQSFDAVNDILKRERKKYAAHSVRKPRKVGGSSSEQVQKGYKLRQRYVDAGESPDWEAIAYECFLKRPGEDTSKATWKQRKERFRTAVNKHRYRLENEARRREK
jgi:hypothetical protein